MNSLRLLVIVRIKKIIKLQKSMILKGKERKKINISIRQAAYMMVNGSETLEMALEL